MARTSAQRPDSSRPDGSGVADSGTGEPVSETVPNGAGRVLGGLPVAAWSRILVLFLALASIKIVLLVGGGVAGLVGDVEWRGGGPRMPWCPPAIAFYLFVCLGVLSLFGLARRC